tara:strand:+ start:278 stop:544 length:267 start_codon:yes stop_codon:yes gene_type:complete
MKFTITDKKVLINNMNHTVTAVNGLDRIGINTRLHYISEELLKLRTKQSELVAMRDELDRICEMQEAGESADECDNLFEQMFGFDEAA